MSTRKGRMIRSSVAYLFRLVMVVEKPPAGYDDER